MLKLKNAKLITCWLVLLLVGCPAQVTNILHKKASYKLAQAKFSSALFFNKSNNNRIFVQIRNLACKQFTNSMEKSIAAAFKKQNFKIVTQPIHAGFILQANIVQCNRNDTASVKQMLDNGYAGAVAENNNLPIQLATEELDDHIIFSIVADLQISERVATDNKSSTSYLVANSMSQKNWMQYQTRLAITKPQLRDRDFNSCAAWLIDEMAASIVKIFIQQ